jgi:predicted CXXCH cytochrome family protein
VKRPVGILIAAAGSTLALVMIHTHLAVGLDASPMFMLIAQHDPCANCHSVHTAPGQSLTNEVVREVLCQTCHSVAGGDIPAEVHNNKTGSSYPAFSITCTDCHEPHDYQDNANSNPNLKLVRADIATPSSGTKGVIFESRGTGAGEPAALSFADGDATYDGVCEVCHTQTLFHKNDGTGAAHNAGDTCVGCHAHDNYFHGSGSCQGCHDKTQGGRREIVSEFSRPSHHLQNTLDDADCEVCHDQSQHQQGSVRLKNVDGGSTVVLTGDPNTNPTEAAKLTPFCLACHDSGGSGPAQPFTDAWTPPAIDSTSWDASSHNTGSRSCFGDGTSGCHASGHGSEKQKLLAPGSVAPTAPANSEEEEGFCLNCHDSDGPASIDLNTAYSQAINWVQTATGLNSNPNLNDRHDVQYNAQLVSGALIECPDCHNPHTATSAQPYILDPDPSDGRVPGTGQVFAGTDTYSEFCMDCHDGSFPPGVQDHTSPQITDIRTTWSSDGMGARTGSAVNIRAGIGWAIGDIMPCWSCHTPHPTLDKDIGAAPGTPTLFAVIDTVLSKSGAYLPYEETQGQTTTTIWAYGITNNLDKNDVTSGGYWCNTCHDRTAMTGKANCYGCHRHGDGGRF